ncbi:MAG: hypothetical protein M0R51_06465 [Clostridia bacterium]|jgi:hypothetical protein|nr:hypothetical protein [Clostridia bacterium]
MSFKPGGNFDRISALILLMITFEDKRRFIINLKKKINKAADDEFFNKGWVENKKNILSIFADNTDNK